MAKSITVFTKNNCPYCKLLKQTLDMKGVIYKVVNIDQDAKALAEVHAMTGRAIAPTMLIVSEDDTKEYIVGYNLARIFPAISNPEA